METIEVSETCNQTLFDYYDSYLQEFKNILGHHFKKCREEFIDYFHENAQHLAIGVFIYIVFSFCFYCFIIRTKLVRHMGTIANCKNVLFVTSHPDDECMFFGPTIISLSNRPDFSVYLLCLSRGNFQNLGKVRKKELYESCKILNVPESHVQIVNSTLLQDDPTVNWNQEVVADIILNFIETYSIDAILTFDRNGVSNHPNHSSLFYAMAHLCLEKKLPRRCKAYALESVSRLRKYLGFLDLPFTYLMSSKKYVVAMDKRNMIRQAMRAHKSQYVWFRKLYMYVSRYIFINSYKEIDVLELELDFEVDDERG
ncbi:hypothetical protein RUM43_011548 [Polyplax serrata]|uniref:N-acetylglucosaminylphosphatidylinositol deacetylase n=1 Tax=Polyplax serrata TaxID=468196 RepID=A0AAN8S149_POLSC